MQHHPATLRAAGQELKFADVQDWKTLAWIPVSSSLCDTLADTSLQTFAKLDTIEGNSGSNLVLDFITYLDSALNPEHQERIDSHLKVLPATLVA